jgi:hypothetical protein
MTELLIFLVERVRRVHESLLPRTSWMQLLGLFNLLAAFLQFFLVRKIPELVVQRHGLAPMRHRALRVSRLRLGKRLPRFFILKGVKESEALFEQRLRLWRATGGEIYLPEMRLGRTR